MTDRVLVVGCGDLGQAAASLLHDGGLEVYGLRRSATALPAGMHLVQADVTQPDTLQGLAALKPRIVIYCVAADAHRDDSYRAHYVDGLRNTLAALRQAPPAHVFFVSSTGVYGQVSDELLDESSVPVPDGFSGERMLQAEQLLEDAYPDTHTILRFSGIYGPGRRRMLDLAREPARWPAQNGWTNRIHRDDGASAIAYLVKQWQAGRPLESLYLVTDDRPASQYEVLQWLAQHMGVQDTPQSAPAVCGNKRLSNQRLRHTGFQLRYPDYQTGYAAMLADEGAAS
jgi:nucleoside-diphosphate-sugar epimerase